MPEIVMPATNTASLDAPDHQPLTAPSDTHRRCRRGIPSRHGVRLSRRLRVPLHRRRRQP